MPPVFQSVSPPVSLKAGDPLVNAPDFNILNRFPMRAAPESVLILKPSSLGDVLHTLPAVAALKQHWPSARVRWLVNPEWAPMLEGNPVVDEVLHFPRQQFRGLFGPVRLLRWARQFAPSGAAPLVLDFQGLLRSALIGRLCRTAHFYGLSDAREGARFFYDAAAPVVGKQHAVERYLALVQMVGARVDSPLRWPLPKTKLPVGFDCTLPFVALHPFSRGRGKSLSVAEVQQICEVLAPRRVVVVGRSELALPVMGNLDNWLNRTSLLELLALLGSAQWCVSVDSGPMHMAAALSARVLALHTWSDPQKVGPFPKEAWVWKKGALYQRGFPETTVSSATLLEAVAFCAALFSPQ